MLFTVIAIVISGLLFGLSHSLLASQRLKNIAYDYGLSPQHYRLGYVVIATAFTVAWLGYVHRLPDQFAYAIDGIGMWACYSVQLVALLLFVLSLLPINGAAFLGLRPFSDDSLGANKEPFIEQGIYRYVRHPMYSSIMLMMFASPVQSYNSLTLYIVISIYFLIGSRLEEQRMIKNHPDYVDYQRRVPAFIPRLPKM